MAESAPTPRPATKRLRDMVGETKLGISARVTYPIVICATLLSVAVWMTTPIVKITWSANDFSDTFHEQRRRSTLTDQMRIDPRRPNRSAVNACPSAPLKRRSSQGDKFGWRG